MGLLAEAKKRQKEKQSKQFISYYDSVLYLGEPKNEALEFVIENLRNEQTHLKIEYGELHLISVERYQDQEDDYHFTDDFIVKNLSKCVNVGHIDETSPIYNLGFAKKSFIEMLVCFGLPVSEAEQKSVQSPDLAFNDDYFEIDYYTYEMVVNERNELRERIENLQPIDNQLSQQLQETIDRQAKEIATLKAQLQQQAGEASQNDPLPELVLDTSEYKHNQRKPIKHLLYALVKNQGLTLTEKGKGNANEVLLNMTQSYNVPVTEGFLQSRLIELYQLEQEIQNNFKNKN